LDLARHQLLDTLCALARPGRHYRHLPHRDVRVFAFGHRLVRAHAPRQNSCEQHPRDVPVFDKIACYVVAGNLSVLVRHDDSSTCTRRSSSCNRLAPMTTFLGQGASPDSTTTSFPASGPGSTGIPLATARPPLSSIVYTR